MITLFLHFPVYLSQWLAAEQKRLSAEGCQPGYFYDVHCAAGAMEVIELRRGSVERALLAECLKAKGSVASPAAVKGTRPSPAAVLSGTVSSAPGDRFTGAHPPTLRVAVPWTAGKPATVYNHLDRKGERELETLVRMRMRKDLYLWMERHYDGGRRGVELQEAIVRYMAERGIEDTDQNFESVKQQYRRQRDVYRKLKVES